MDRLGLSPLEAEPDELEALVRSSWMERLQGLSLQLLQRAGVWVGRELAGG